MLSKIPLKTEADLVLMREACRVTAQILDEVGAVVQPGVSTEDIDRFVAKRMREMDAIPATLNYRGYPKSCCVSPNEVVCHGIPHPKVVLKSGDIVNVDVTSIKGGFHGDSSRMYLVGGDQAVAPEARQLVRAAYDAMWKAIRIVKPGARIGDIGATIGDYIKQLDRGYGIVREYTGHGLGREFHEPPQVVHIAKRGTGEVMKAGMTFTIEPMINAGTHRTTLDPVDRWTVRTEDGLLSAQWEHTVLVTPTGFEVMTLSAAERANQRRGDHE